MSYSSAHCKIHYFEDDGIVPNNPLPLILYQGIVSNLDPGRSLGRYMDDVFDRNHWQGSWWDGIFPFHHYHSIAHEVLGVYEGNAEVMLGGPKGKVFNIRYGDIVIIPAGVAHKKINASNNFGVIGAYPDGMPYDMKYCKAEERPEADQQIAKVPIPVRDPLFGNDPNAIFDYWK